jgi:hypothetical protein
MTKWLRSDVCHLDTHLHLWEGAHQSTVTHTLINHPKSASVEDGPLVQAGPPTYNQLPQCNKVLFLKTKTKNKQTKKVM